MSAVRRSGPLRYAVARRFGPPEPVTPTAGPAVVCPQLPSRLDRVTGPPRDGLGQNEDCLALSVVAPGSPGPHPVLVFLHGGGFSSGSGLLSWYDGGSLAAEQDVVVVSVSYRLGPFGWLALDGVSEPNLGLLDVMAALRWVRDGIDRVGGDPTRITVAGQSAGGIMIGYLLETPEGRRLMDRAVVQSAPILPGDVPAHVRRAAHDLVGNLGGADPATAPSSQILEAYRTAVGEHIARTGSPIEPALMPVRGAPPIPAEPVAVPDHPGDLDLLVGWNADDLGAFPLDPDDVAPVTDRLLAAPWIERTDRIRAAGARVTRYRLDWRPSGSAFGATHCLELPLLFGDRAAWEGAPMLGTTGWPEVDRLGRGLRAVWAEFARSGRVEPDLAPDVPVRWDTVEAPVDLLG